MYIIGVDMIRDYQDLPTIYPLYLPRNTIHKKREVHLFLTLLKGFAIPVTGSKTTEIHARYAKPASPYSEAWIYNIPTWTFIVVATTSS